LDSRRNVSKSWPARTRGYATSGEELYQLGERHVTKGLARLTQGFMEKGRGSYVEYDDGRKYLDFSSGIGVTSLGKYFSQIIVNAMKMMNCLF